MDYTAQMAGINGTYTIAGVGAVTKDAISIYVSTDTVFANLEINGVVADVRTTYFDSAGATIKAGTLLTCGNTNKFSKIQLTSGQVTLVLK